MQFGWRDQVDDAVTYYALAEYIERTSCMICTLSEARAFIAEETGENGEIHDRLPTRGGFATGQRATRSRARMQSRPARSAGDE